MPQPVLAYTRRDANRRNTRLLLVLFSLVLLPVGLAIGLAVLPIVTIGLGLFVVALFSREGDPIVGGPSVAVFFLLPLIVVVGKGISIFRALTFRFGSRMILRSARATPLRPGEEPELVRTVENLCIGAGLPLPSIYLIESPAPNTFATGPDPEGASLAVTRGLLELLNQRELEGVIAHELSHIGNDDIRLTTTLAALVSIAILPFSMAAAIRTAMFEGEAKFTSENVILLLAMLAGTGSFMLWGLRWGSVWWLGPAYLLAVSPVLALLIRTAVSQQREFLADADAALLTRDPEGLALALVKIATARGDRLRVGEGSVHVYFADPLAEEESWIHRMFPSHPAVERRIELLAQMGSGITRADLQSARDAGMTALPRQDVAADTDGAPLEPSALPVRDDSERTSMTPLYEQPDGWSRVLRRLSIDAAVKPVGRQGDFIRVLTNDGVTGYVSCLGPLAARLLSTGAGTQLHRNGPGTGR